MQHKRKNGNRRTATSKEIELVLGGGGIKGFGHIGLLKALEERQVSIGTITGVSIGSVVAAFHTNGYTPEEINRIFIIELMGLDPDSLKRTLHLPSTARLLKRGFVDLGELFRKIVDKYELKPQPNLRILAYNVLKAEPVLFEGTDYDLSKAISASCAIPGVMRPVWHGRNQSSGKPQARCRHGESEDGILVDGGVHHPNPGEFSEGTAIISKLGFASSLPSLPMPIFDLGFHLLEMFWSFALSWYFADPEDHLVIQTGLPDVACLSFGLAPEKCKEMVKFGYRQACRSLDPAIKKGLIPLKPKH